ncbi:hypothetical protein M011DRAFT_145965 [Sporormia fimetaria CBS 119925]|uniref:Uncharacterized protein n=1 Tax=Sporormia fimetaria CBS 119925 TaxID=1340428 RepID=A0A6A6V638_9PLEO|nr:hypothetical protein M011DRAFT_145965 [Sporormia fimetaria CBS 119925]
MVYDYILAGQYAIHTPSTTPNHANNSNTGDASPFSPDELAGPNVTSFITSLLSNLTVPSHPRTKNPGNHNNRKPPQSTRLQQEQSYARNLSTKLPSQRFQTPTSSIAEQTTCTPPLSPEIAQLLDARVTGTALALDLAPI